MNKQVPTVAFPSLQCRAANTHNQLTHTTLQSAQPKMVPPSLASGWHALRVSRSDLTGKIPSSEKFVGRLPHRLTWVWRNRGIVSLESVWGTTNYVARGKFVLMTKNKVLQIVRRKLFLGWI